MYKSWIVYFIGRLTKHFEVKDELYHNWKPEFQGAVTKDDHEKNVCELDCIDGDFAVGNCSKS